MPQKLSKQYHASYPIQVYELAKTGLTDREISKQLIPPVAYRTFLHWKKTKEEITQSVEIGRRYAHTNNQLQLRDPKQIAFLMAYGECGTLTEASQLAGTAINNHYKWLDQDERYQRAFEMAKLRFAESLISSATSRARDGLKDYKFHNGRPIYVECEPTHPEAQEVTDPDTGKNKFVRHYYVRRYSDRLLAKMLEAYDKRFSVQQPPAANVTVHGSANLIQQVLQDVEQARDSVLDDRQIDAIAHHVTSQQLKETSNDPAH